jgi:hypothetical protein
MPRKTFNVRPANHAMSTENPTLYMGGTSSPAILNCRFDQNSLKKRWGYELDRSPLSKVYEIVLFSLVNGTRYTLYLTETDLLCRESTGTFSFKTATSTTPVVTSMNGGKTVITFSGGGITASGVAAADKFIIDADHTATSEIDAQWATVLSKDSDTQITLSPAYTGSATSGAAKLRKIYSVPSNERWSWAIVSDKFCFGNGNHPVQYWAGSGYAADLNATYALNARHMIEYANRLFLGDVDASGVRSAITIRWSKENDPTDWTDSTAGELDLMDTENYITGFGKTGNNLIIFKQDNTYVYSRTGVATDPIVLTALRRGVGNVAPYSAVSFLGTTAWIGRDDFYVMDGDQPVSVGEKIRTKFFDEVGDTEIKKVFGAVNHNSSEAMWVATTNNGAQSVYVYNYKWKEWMINQYPVDITAYGKGAL